LDAGVSSSKIVIAGFSQGGALALHFAMRSTHKLGGCVALSTWLPLKDDYPAAASETAKSLPILQVHGDRDQVVAHQWGKGSHDILKTIIQNPAPQFHTISASKMV
jgi:lysophospholipase-2